MSAKYRLVENPPASRKEGVTELHARIVASRTATMDDLAEEIGTISSFSTGDIKGLLTSFSEVIIRRLKNGENVNLEDLGYYSVSLECPKGVTSDKQIRSASVRFKNVNFRCSAKMKDSLKSMSLERETSKKKQRFSAEQRMKHIQDYLQSNRTVTASQCCAFNQCSHFSTMSDLRALINAEKVEKLGYGKNVLYMLSQNTNDR